VFVRVEASMGFSLLPSLPALLYPKSELDFISDWKMGFTDVITTLACLDVS
jgi:hypothetical protein